jgi:hypothetical protein
MKALSSELHEASSGLINTPLQRGETVWEGKENRFSGFSGCRVLLAQETAEAVQSPAGRKYTPLKRGANET